jgi:hypothetical protein
MEKTQASLDVAFEQYHCAAAPFYDPLLQCRAGGGNMWQDWAGIFPAAVLATLEMRR